MGLFQTINSEAHNRHLQFLVIGGLAVNFHGYSRDTADLDLLIRQDAREQWLSLFAELGYTVYRDKNAFVQLSPPTEGAWPVDLMMVREPTFRPIFDHGKEVEMYGARVQIPTLEHLLALKLHALKHTNAGRFLKDFLDVENLVKVNKVDLRSNGVRQMFLKYGTMEIYEKNPAPAPPNSFQLNEAALAADLELPVAPEFDSRPPRIDPQAMLRRIEETMPWRSTRPGEQERRLAEKIAVEFVL